MGMMPFRLLETVFTELETNENNIVVEIGSENGEGSSFFLHRWAKERGLDFYSVDVVDRAQQRYQDLDINFVVAESGSQWCQNVLPTLNKKIKVLYLDNFDWLYDCWTADTPPWVQDQILQYANRGIELNNENSLLEHKLQAQYCLPYLDDQCVVLIDDTFETYYKTENDDYVLDRFSGKCGHAIPLLRAAGFKLFREGLGMPNVLAAFRGYDLGDHPHQIH